jgi:hypothetical protein
MNGTDVAQPLDLGSSASFPPMPPMELETRQTRRVGRSIRERVALWLLVILGVPMMLLVAAGVFLRLVLSPRPYPPYRRAQSALRGTLFEAEYMFDDSGTYEGATAPGLSAASDRDDSSFPAASFSFVNQQIESTAPLVGAPHVVSVAGTKTMFVAAAKSTDGRCFFIMTSEPLGRRYAETHTRPCAAAKAPDPASPLWAEAWPVEPLTD